MQDHFFAVPEALIFAANQLAMVVAYGPADDQTFGPANSVDAEGNRYQARNIWAPETLFAALQAPLVRPEWDTEDYIDMDAAKQAQDALVLRTEGDIPLASPLSLTALGGMNGEAALAALGLTLIYTDAQE